MRKSMSLSVSSAQCPRLAARHPALNHAGAGPRQGPGLPARAAERVQPPHVAAERDQQQVHHVEAPGLRPSEGDQAGSRRMEGALPSMQRWKVSATRRPPTPVMRPSFSSASRRT